ncbi:MAG: 1-(5-phosphoribosyl)-5-((5-phosphoribosylamino)methylideneamino)imidazole-4-carboxamide isomerase [Bacteroidetes bacterium]|nr:1-(5-phosphoribosyl)-5-((5-phosphoribosylamino)methylideneamino)imidazole-4-carboxamide isomerase [Bacteroidota bacterium]
MDNINKTIVKNLASDVCQLIPALDLLDHRAVRLMQGDFRRVTDYGDPSHWTQRWWDAGARRLHVVDLAGARDGTLSVLPLLRSWAERGWDIQLGGGIRSVETVEQVLSAGVNRVVLGTAAVTEPDFLARCLDRFGPDSIVAGLDLREGVPQVSGWLLNSEQRLDALLEGWKAAGVRWILSTAVLRDGTLQGPDLAQYQQLSALLPGVQWIASGGVRHKADLVQLAAQGIPFAVAGRSILEGWINPEEAWR